MAAHHHCSSAGTFNRGMFKFVVRRVAGVGRWAKDGNPDRNLPRAKCFFQKWQTSPQIDNVPVARNAHFHPGLEQKGSCCIPLEVERNCLSRRA